jgi:hypothetical protein
MSINTSENNPVRPLYQPACLRVLLCVLTLLLCTPAFADKKITGANNNPAGANTNNPAGGNPNGWYDPEPGAPPFDETSVFLNVQRIGGAEIPAVIKDRAVYLPVTSLFDYLKIKNQATPNFDSVFGYFLDPNATFCVDNIRYQIRFKGTVYKLQSSDLVQTETNLYLKLDYFNQVFGLNSTFDFSNLTVKMDPSVELPAVREMQLEQMHQNLSKLRGETKADTVIRRRYPFFNLSFADWSLFATQQSGGAPQDMRAGLALGGVIAGGEANVYLNYNNNTPFKERQQFYQWRFANNEHRALRQVTLGRIYTQATATLFDPVIGVQVTNTPTTYRKSAGSYRLSRTTEPGWTVELYVNNVLVDFAKADASGFFSFDVPLVYGNSVIKLRYYGLYGEERTLEENVTIPFNFLPKNELEYSASAGLVEDTLNSRYGKASINYGFSRFITVGAGTEYLSSVSSGSNMPFATASARIGSTLMLSGIYVHGIKTQGTATYRMPHNAQLEVNYIKYDREQRALMYNYIEERKLIYSVPFYAHNFAGVTRLMINQAIITENTSYNTAEWLISGATRNLSANVNTFLVSAGQKDPPHFDPYIYSNASLVYRLPKGFNLMPQTQYSFKEGSFISAKCEVEKSFFQRGYFNIAYEQNFKTSQSSFTAGMRYDFSFAKASLVARNYNGVSSISETATGSLIFDAKTGYVGLNNRTSVGRAGITLLPYLDVNGNGRRDAGEQRVPGLKVGIASGRVQYSNSDTVIRLYDLEPYTNYFVDVSQNSFENINWQVRNKTMNVQVDPNQMKLIEVPVSVMSDGSGFVYLKDSTGKTKPLGRISVCFYNGQGVRMASVISDADGYFSYMGLMAGEYTVRIAEEQLSSLHMKSSSEHHFTVAMSPDGSSFDDLDFTLERKKD